MEKEQDVFKTVRAHLIGRGAGQGLKPRAYLAENPKGPTARCPRERQGFLPLLSLPRAFKAKEYRAVLLFCWAERWSE